MQLKKKKEEEERKRKAEEESKGQEDTTTTIAPTTVPEVKKDAAPGISINLLDRVGTGSAKPPPAVRPSAAKMRVQKG